jgi:hypothetical protein
MKLRIDPLASMSLPSGSSGIGWRSYPRDAGQATTIAILLLFAAAGLWAQTPPPNPDQSNPKPEAPPCQQTLGAAARPSPAESQSGKESAEKKPNGASPDGASPNANAPNGSLPDRSFEDNCVPQSKKDEEEGKQTNRILWVVPNFAAVSANTQLPPLSVKGKFWLATEDTFDYSAFVWTGILAGQEFASQTDKEFGQGMAGYGRYYYHLFIDGVSGSFFTEAIVPSITHEDPRYYTLGHGGFFRRTGYALSRVVLTKTDSGGTSFNWSEIGGNALEAGLSNAYYPAQERGARQTAINWGAQLESAALNNIAKEFWPDIRRFLFREKEKKEK